MNPFGVIPEKLGNSTNARRCLGLSRSHVRSQSPVPHHLWAQAKWALELLPDSAMARVDCGHDHDKGTGSGPATPQTIVNYLKVNGGGTDYWLALTE